MTDNVAILFIPRQKASLRAQYFWALPVKRRGEARETVSVQTTSYVAYTVSRLSGSALAWPEL